MEPTQWYFVLLIGGLIMIGAEIYIPGGVVGLIGSLFLMAAMVVGFKAFGAQWGLASSFFIILLAGACLVAWIKYFPKTRIGRSLTLSDDAKTFKATEEHLPELYGQEGLASTELRPSGIATINNQRVDVVAEGDWIDKGSNIRVVKVEGNVITVRKVSDAQV